MFNVLRNKITKEIRINSEKLIIINKPSKNFITNNKQNLLNYSEFTLMTDSNNNKIFNKKNQTNFSMLKINKLISCNFSTIAEKKDQGNSLLSKPVVGDTDPTVYNIIIEKVNESPNLNEEEKSALLEKLKNYLNTHIEVNEERKKKEWIEVYKEIMHKWRKEDEEKYFDEYESIVESYKLNLSIKRRKRKAIYRKTIKRGFMMFLIMMLINFYFYKRGKNNSENNPVHIQTLNNFWDWIASCYQSISNKFSIPYATKLLPDQLALPGQPLQKTLVINFENTLIDYNYHIGSGMDCKGRPFLQKFLDELSPYYEIVIFSNFNDSHFVEEIVKSIDKMGNRISHILGKEASTRYQGLNIKDLNYLNRDLKNIIAIDFKEENLKKHSKNLVLLPAFKGEETDKMAKKEVSDVRTEIEKYGNYKTYLNYYRSNPKYKALLPKDTEKATDDKDFSFMKLIKEMKKESGININLSTEFQTDKAPKLKFEPNVNLKRNYVPQPEADKLENNEQQQNLINLNQISSRFEAKDSLNKKNQQKKGEKKSNLIMLADMLKSEASEKKPKKIRNEDEDIRGIVNNLRAKDQTGYYPTTLPFKLNDIDENNIIKDLINEKGTLNETNNFLFQFPRVIPYNLEIQDKMKNDELDNEEPTYDSNGYLVKAEFQNVFKAIKNNMNIGKIKFYKSGRIKMQIGSSLFDVSGGINTKFAQEIALYSGQTDEIVFLGKVNDKKVIVTPDFK